MPRKRSRPTDERWLRCAAGGAALLLFVPCLRAAADASVAAIRREVERLRSELSRFDERESGLLASLERMSLERLLIEEEIRALDLDRGGLERDARETEGRIEELGRRIDAERTSLAASLRSTYQLGRTGRLRLAVEAGGSVETGRALRTLAAWARADTRRIARFREATAAAAAEQGALAARLSDLERVRRDRSGRAGDLERLGLSQRAALDRLGQERDAGRLAVAELEEAAGRLQGLLATLPEGDQAVVDGRFLDLQLMRGHFPWPVQGRVAVPFGAVRHPRFRTVTPHSGIDIVAPEGTPVHPIFGGEVAYAAWFRGYGNTVIVDHGGAVVSIYSHLRSVGVMVGDRVAPDRPLGLSGSTGSLVGASLYLEIRIRGASVDPEEWLQPKGRPGPQGRDR